jgi:hypothetical protein
MEYLIVFTNCPQENPDQEDVKSHSNFHIVSPFQR